VGCSPLLVSNSAIFSALPLLRRIPFIRTEAEQKRYGAGMECVLADIIVGGMKTKTSALPSIQLPGGLHLPGSSVFAPSAMKPGNYDQLYKIFSGSTAGLVIKDAVDDTWCDELNNAFIKHPSTKKEGVEPPIYSLGSHLYACGSGTTVPCYFDTLEESNKAISEILPKGFDPLISSLKEACDFMACDFEFLKHEGKEVRHGNLRLWGAGTSASPELSYFALPHEDYEETNSNHPMLEQIHGLGNIYSIILCTDAIEGYEPETILWNGRLSLEQVLDPENRHDKGSYGFSETVLENFEATSIRLRKGDMGIIPAHNIHAVVGYPGFARSTYMAFFQVEFDEFGKPSRMVFRT